MNRTIQALAVSQIKSTSMRLVTAILGTSLAVLCLLQPGHSSAEGEDAPKGRIPPVLVTRLKELLQKKAPDGKILVDDGETFDFADRCRDYRIQPAHGPGSYEGPSWAMLGPTKEGFRLKLTWLPSSLEDRIMNGPSGTMYMGRILPVDYWYKYTNCYKLADNQGFVWMDYELGSLPDQGLLTDAGLELKSVGEHVVSDRTDHWEDYVGRLHAQLTEVLDKRQPLAKWRRDGKVLVCEYETQEYDIHAIDEKGNVAAEAHHEVGPLSDGFIIRLSHYENVVGLQAVPIYGRSDHTYWRHYFTIAKDFSFRMDLLYGVTVDKILLEEVTAAAEKYSVPLSRF